VFASYLQKGLNAFGCGVISAVASVLKADKGAKLYPPFYLLTGLLSQLEKVLEDTKRDTPKSLKVGRLIKGINNEKVFDNHSFLLRY
jgi:hypothetical protein